MKQILKPLPNENVHFVAGENAIQIKNKNLHANATVSRKQI